MFHAYQYEKTGYLQASTSVEVEAYLFQDIVGLQSGGPVGHVSSGYLGQQYDKARNNMLFDGFNNIDYLKANLFFKDSAHNASGLYDETPIKYIPTAAEIRAFLPVFK